MYARLRLALGLSALCFGLAVMPAHATVSSRTANFLFTCDGTNKTVPVPAGGFAPGSAQNILGARIILFESNGLQYIVLRAEADSRKEILTMGLNENSATVIMPGYTFIPPTTLIPPGTATSSFFPVIANGAGNVDLAIDGACNPGGANRIQGRATIWFVLP
jgi:hypothetical protein